MTRETKIGLMVIASVVATVTVMIRHGKEQQPKRQVELVIAGAYQPASFSPATMPRPFAPPRWLPRYPSTQACAEMRKENYPVVHGQRVYSLSEAPDPLFSVLVDPNMDNLLEVRDLKTNLLVTPVADAQGRMPRHVKVNTRLQALFSKASISWNEKDDDKLVSLYSAEPGTVPEPCVQFRSAKGKDDDQCLYQLEFNLPDGRILYFYYWHDIKFGTAWVLDAAEAEQLMKKMLGAAEVKKVAKKSSSRKKK